MKFLAHTVRARFFGTRLGGSCNEWRWDSVHYNPIVLLSPLLGSRAFAYTNSRSVWLLLGADEDGSKHDYQNNGSARIRLQENSAGTRTLVSYESVLATP